MYTLTTLAKRWNVRRNSLWVYVRRGDIPAHCGPRGYIIDSEFVREMDAIMAWLDGESRKIEKALAVYRLKQKKRMVDHILSDGGIP